MDLVHGAQPRPVARQWHQAVDVVQDQRRDRVEAQDHQRRPTVTPCQHQARDQRQRESARRRRAVEHRTEVRETDRPANVVQRRPAHREGHSRDRDKAHDQPARTRAIVAGPAPKTFHPDLRGWTGRCRHGCPLD
ncbi:hypothetical protein DC74_p00001 (plasmid) [Streptomyces noursei]|nr:hypothetical protein DC74_p00001 [Streptomyces noursei]